MSNFNLENYKADIMAIADKHQVPVEKAVNMFVLNLNVMRENFPGASSAINFHMLGQQWSNLPSAVRQAQKASVLQSLTSGSTSRSGRTNNSIMK